MPKKTARRSNKNFVAIPFDNSIALSTLTNGAVLSVGLIGANFTNNFFAISADLAASIDGLTAGEGVPSDAGINHGDYSNLQIQENQEVALTGPGDKIALERTRRLVRKSGVLNSFDTSAKTETTLIGKLGSRIVRTSLKFVIQKDRSIESWVRNRSGTALQTGATYRISGTLYGRWI